MLSNITIYNLYNKLSNQTREKLILFETGKEISFGITGLFKNKKVALEMIQNLLNKYLE